MIIYTSHFFKNFDETKYQIVQISQAIPTNKPTDYKLECLYPPDDLRLKYKNGTIKFDEFAKEYSAYLETVDIHLLKSKIEELFQRAQQNNKFLVLTCWETQKTSCHRCIIEKFLLEKLDIVCMELE